MSYTYRRSIEDDWRMREHILTRTVAPAEAIISVADFKTNNNIAHADDDTLIGGLVAAAEAMLDGPRGRVGKCLVNQTWAYSVRCADDRLSLPAVPAVSITSVSYFDGAGDEQTLNLDGFWFQKSEDWAYLEPKSGFAWPALEDRADALTVTYVAGFGANADAVPANLKQAALLMVGHWYENREDTTYDKALREIPMGAASLIDISRIGWIGA